MLWSSILGQRKTGNRRRWESIIYFCDCIIEVLEVFYVSPCISDTFQDKID